MTKKYKQLDNVICKYCGYANSKNNYLIYGTCTRCGKILDSKIKFKHDMKIKLRIGAYKNL